MSQVTRKKLQEALKEVGVQSGDLLFIHSDLRPFGFPEDLSHNSKSEDLLQFYFDLLMEAVGGASKGTLVVPAYFYEYARYGEPFDIELSPVSKPLGVFSAFINQIKGRVRSASPLQSCAAIGKMAHAICGGDLLSGYGVTSPWHRLIMNKAKFLFIGTSLQPLTFIHHIEQQFGVPHLYTKIFLHPVLCHGKSLPGKVMTSVRYLEYGIEYQLQKFQAELAKLEMLRKVNVGKGELLLASAEDIYTVGIAMLSLNPFAFLRNPPEFVPGKIPMDGNTSSQSQEVKK